MVPPAPVWPFSSWTSTAEEPAAINEELIKMASLVLEDGTSFKGKLFGATKSTSGEVGMLCRSNSC